MRIDASGNLGLGVTPSAWGSLFKSLDIGAASGFSSGAVGQPIVGYNFYHNNANHIYKTTAFASKYEQASGQHQWYNAPSGTAGNAISFTQAMTLDASGNLLVGATAGAARIISAVADGTYSFGAVGTTKAIRISHSSTASKIEGVDSTLSASYEPLALNGSYLSFETSVTERARITSSGDLLVGKTTASGTTVGPELLANGQINTATANLDNLNIYNTTAAAYRFYVNAAGTVFATNTTISAISDQRLKENVQDLDAGLDKIMALKPRKFDWKAGKGKNIKGDRGFIAQEFEQVFPDLIDEWKDPVSEGEEPYKSVRQDLIPVLVKAIQELKAEVDSLKTQLGA